MFAASTLTSKKGSALDHTANSCDERVAIILPTDEMCTLDNFVQGRVKSETSSFRRADVWHQWAAFPAVPVTVATKNPLTASVIVLAVGPDYLSGGGGEHQALSGLDNQLVQAYITWPSISASTTARPHGQVVCSRSATNPARSPLRYVTNAGDGGASDGNAGDNDDDSVVAVCPDHPKPDLSTVPIEVIRQNVSPTVIAQAPIQ
jgi:hypothetical protein